MGGLGFCRPSREALDVATRHLYVANCGPREIIPIDALTTTFSRFGTVEQVLEADSSGNRIIVSFSTAAEAEAAKAALDRRKCDSLGGLTMVVQFAVPRSEHKSAEPTPIYTSSEELHIPGLYLLTDFISPEEERELIEAADQRPWQLLAKRRVQHHGYEFLYTVRNVDPNRALGGLPEYVQPLLDKLSNLSELTKDPEAIPEFDQLTVNEYPRGVGLSPHIDTHSAFQGPIISLSLAGSCVMEFRKYNPSDKNSKSCEKKGLFLPPRSLLVLTNEARYAWHHYIPHHKIDYVGGQEVRRSPRRVSYTFRKIRAGPCFCTFSQYCDSQSGTQCSEPKEDSEPESVESDSKSDLDSESKAESVESDCKSDLDSDSKADHEPDAESKADHAPDSELLATPDIEKTFVHKVYDAIAPHFSATRFAKWPKVAEFLDGLPSGSLVLDAGCGNGKYLGYNKECVFIGCDISPPLVNICSQKGHEALVADAVNLAFRAGSFDAAISIAVLHHLSTESRRRRAIAELLRVVRKGGKVLVTVWAAEQEDRSLLKKWTPLSEECMEEWVGDMSRKGMQRSSSKASSLGKIDEDEHGEQVEQEYFVPWHLPYHRAEIGGAAAAVEGGFARRDDKKSAVVYNRFYHVFVEGELERLISGLDDALIVDRFYDKSNWCLLLQKI